jgi:hypothetical protein
MEFYNIFQDFDLTNLVHTATHHLGNRLDLILCTFPASIEDIFVEKDAFPSDHFVLNFSLQYPHLNNTAKRRVFNYKKANWTGLKDSLQSSNLNLVIEENRNNLTEACSAWTKIVLENILK